MRQHKIGHMVQGKRQLQPVLSHAAVRENRASVVDQDINPRLRCGDLRGHALHLRQPGKVGVVNGVLNAGRNLPQTS